MSTKSIRFYVVVVAIILFTSYETMIAQVTIGADKLPETFSVLQLEGKYSKDKHGGLRLPQLTSKERDELALEQLTDPTQKQVALGLTIYNVSIDCMEYWNGRKWVSDSDCCPAVVTDIEGNTYTTAQFGDAGCWMTQNLRSKKYSNGVSLVSLETAAANSADYPCYWYPNHNGTVSESSITILQDHPEYGLLYNWKGVMGYDISQAGRSTAQGICPEGWVVPSDLDWNLLEKEISLFPQRYSTNTGTTWEADWATTESSMRGGHGKSIKSTTPVAGAVNSPDGSSIKVGGFEALLVGRQNATPPFPTAANDYSTHFHCSTEADNDHLWTRFIIAGDDGVRRFPDSKTLYFFSVRCKKTGY